MLASPQASYNSSRRKSISMDILLQRQGLQTAENKLQAIKKIKVPENAAELIIILGMINYLNRVSVKLA